LDMGEPVKIVDLARKMLRLAGKSEDQIVFTGLDEGEKLYEELLLDDKAKDTKYPSIFVAKKTPRDLGKLKKEI
ncbi:MAG TPA: UDP-N-acetylglucosamine 4,6-dehydratase, partial [Spirochaetaceae bacterium]|nr:UDP-N-acetylglucosamine 4,6-dehydratase [Spirochaetaceae bacterium]